MTIDDLVKFLSELKSELEDSDSSLIKEIDDYIGNDEEGLKSVLDELMIAKEALKVAKDNIGYFRNSLPYDAYDPDKLEAIAEIATKLDNAGFVKDASVLDEILLTIGANKKKILEFKQAQQAEITRLREKYRDDRREEAYVKAREDHEKEINTDEAVKAIDKRVKKYRPLEASLSTRYSPDMPGVSMIRVGDNVYQCPITKKVYDFSAGFTTAKGNKVPGGDVTNQTQHLGFRADEHTIFSTREQVLNDK